MFPTSIVRLKGLLATIVRKEIKAGFGNRMQRLFTRLGQLKVDERRWFPRTIAACINGQRMPPK